MGERGPKGQPGIPGPPVSKRFLKVPILYKLRLMNRYFFDE